MAHELIECPDRTIANGVVTINPPDRRLDSVATYTCNDNFAKTMPPQVVTNLYSHTHTHTHTVIVYRVHPVS